MSVFLFIMNTKAAEGGNWMRVYFILCSNIDYSKYFSNASELLFFHNESKVSRDVAKGLNQMIVILKAKIQMLPGQIHHGLKMDID